ncbi:MAG: hypothetical protein WD672_01150 [Woeseia sp.]
MDFAEIKVRIVSPIIVMNTGQRKIGFTLIWMIAHKFNDRVADEEEPGI